MTQTQTNAQMYLSNILHDVIIDHKTTPHNDKLPSGYGNVYNDNYSKQPITSVIIDPMRTKIRPSLGSSEDNGNAYILEGIMDQGSRSHRRPNFLTPTYG